MHEPCECNDVHAVLEDAEKTFLGTDLRNGRRGDVALHRCPECGAQWLHYLVEYEAFTGSGRWFCGRLHGEAAATVSASNAIATLASLDWYWFGGSYFEGTVGKGAGPVPVDLYGTPAIE